MKGDRTLWIPGTDHAAISTQSKFEKELTKTEKKSRHDFSREEFFTMVNEFGLKNQKDMQQQMRTLGSSLDWSREAFTLDAKRENAVRTAFKSMYEAGLIYKKNRIVNWDPKGQTTISDDEVVYEARKAVMYTFKYSKDFPIAISTTRPETKVGDVAIAVHPDDTRYTKYIGKEYDTVFCGVPIHIKIIADKEVEKDFGTGALGVTPAHSMTDWEIAERHNLPQPQVINEYAKMMVGDERLMGKKVLEAREAIVAWLREEGLIENEETVDQNVSTAERTSGIIEPLPKLQWFIDVNKSIPHKDNKSLKELMREPVVNKDITILPDHFEKIYFHWIENLRDWCISRQIIYGHRIPVWYRSTSLTAGKDDETYCGIAAPAGDGWTQDADTLDTWFSSGLWTFSTLGWPEGKNELKAYHPTTLINPGYEILFPWVARMIMMSQFHLGEIPFKNVYMHGLVRNSNGQKFSKSLNNGVEPEEIIRDFGTDALRMSMIVGVGPGSDLSFDTQKIKGYKNFANKIWNISRFVLEKTEDYNPESILNDTDKVLLEEFANITKDITTDMENYRFHLASEKIYHYIWHRYADEILEESKIIFAEGNDSKTNSRKKVLLDILSDSLKVLHPFMPFITEEIWSMIPARTVAGGPTENKKLLMVTLWPSLE